MGTFIDHEYFCKGDKASVAKARECIERFQDTNAAYSGNGNCNYRAPPKVAADGMSLKYGFYSTANVDALHVSLARLTKSGAMVLFHYEGCTDGTNEGELCRIEHGKCTGRHRFDADIGLRASMAIAKFDQGEDEAAFADLIESYRALTNGGVVHGDPEKDLADESFDARYFGTDIVTEGVIADHIGAALTTYPELLDSLAVRTALVGLRRSFIQTKGLMSKLGGFDPSSHENVDGLIARLEGFEIGLAAKAPTRKPGRSGAARAKVRV